MKYMTKHWYETMQKMNIYLSLKIDERASELSEDLYQELYQKEKLNTLKYSWSPEQVEDFIKNYDSSKNIPAEKLEELFKNIRATAKKRAENVDEYFQEILEREIEMYKQKLPMDILKEIKDIRILALNYTTKEIYDKIKQFCETNKEFVEKMCSDYKRVEEEQFKDIKPAFIIESFHDSDIKTSKMLDNDLLLELDNTGAFTDVTTVVFKSARILKQECNLKNCWWLYEELYKIDNRYEVHILLRDEDGELKDLILICDDIVLKK